MKIKLVSDYSELEGIKKLQEANLSSNISKEEATSQGFLMASYTMDLLKMMHHESPSIIAVDEGKVVGYALVATKEVCQQHDLLADLVNSIDKITYQNRSLKNVNYVVVGQLCVAKTHRGIGLVQQLYGYYRDQLNNQFEYCITDVAQANPRSLKAHQKTGFTVIDTLSYGGIGWDIVLWDWR
jgi:GNAT superfamily N-acetyltransferase